MAAEELPVQHPDRLVAFLHFLLTDTDFSGDAAIDKDELQELVDAATEANLGEVPKSDVAPELYDIAYALTGATSKARGQIASLSDGERPGFKGVGEDQIALVVERVTAELAEETARSES